MRNDDDSVGHCTFTDVENAPSASMSHVRGAHVGTGSVRSDDVKYMLLIYMNPTTWETLSEEERNAVFRGHEEFQKTIKASGEMIGTEALADPSESATVRVRGGSPVVTDGPY